MRSFARCLTTCLPVDRPLICWKSVHSWKIALLSWCGSMTACQRKNSERRNASWFTTLTQQKGGKKEKQSSKCCMVIKLKILFIFVHCLFFLVQLLTSNHLRVSRSSFLVRRPVVNIGTVVWNDAMATEIQCLNDNVLELFVAFSWKDKFFFQFWRMCFWADTIVFSCF